MVAPTRIQTFARALRRDLHKLKRPLSKVNRRSALPVADEADRDCVLQHNEFERLYGAM